MFTIHGSPATKRGAKPGQSGRGRGAVRAGHLHNDPGTENYEMRVAGAAGEVGLQVGSRPCSVLLELVLPSRARKDADRVLTAVFDGMRKAGKAALADDNLCIIQDTRVVLLGIDPIAPRTIVTVTLLDYDRSKA